MFESKDGVKNVMNKRRDKAILGVGFVENLLPKELFPTPVAPRRTILGWGRVSSEHPHDVSSPQVMPRRTKVHPSNIQGSISIVQ